MGSESWSVELTAQVEYLWNRGMLIVCKPMASKSRIIDWR